jgi:hypothetical protein
MEKSFLFYLTLCYSYSSSRSIFPQLVVTCSSSFFYSTRVVFQFLCRRIDRAGKVSQFFDLVWTQLISLPVPRFAFPLGSIIDFSSAAKSRLPSLQFSRRAFRRSVLPTAPQVRAPDSISCLDFGRRRSFCHLIFVPVHQGLFSRSSPREFLVSVKDFSFLCLPARSRSPSVYSPAVVFAPKAFIFPHRIPFQSWSSRPRFFLV